jgi:hypothetical protein
VDDPELAADMFLNLVLAAALPIQRPRSGIER